MFKTFGALCLTLALGLCLQTAEAQDGAKKGKKGRGGRADVEARFKTLDANGDNKLSKSEFLKGADRIADKIQDKGKADKIRESMARSFDKNSTDGYMSLDQYRTYVQERFKGKGNFGNRKKGKKKTEA